MDQVLRGDRGLGDAFQQLVGLHELAVLLEQHSQDGCLGGAQRYHVTIRKQYELPIFLPEVETAELI